MDVATFRWVLIGIGVLLIAGVFLFSRGGKDRPRRASRRSRPDPGGRREPTLGDLADEVDEDDARGQRALDLREEDDDDPEPLLRPIDAGPPPEPMPAPDRIVTLFLRARDNHTISGLDLLDAAIKAGLEFGDMDIFHRRVEGNPKPVFSMADLTRPGTFDRESWNTFETKGVTLFMTLPGPMKALDAWDAMLAAARNLGQRLHADILDDQHAVLSRERSAEIREEMRRYDREQEPEDVAGRDGD